ncbi:MAG TPA: DUF1016 N-terminal domain-containing protein, partial [Povalibacter sp.]|nr:DUF1016 N-terminal domain-containing protein [Povalibacter sp.]
MHGKRKTSVSTSKPSALIDKRRRTRGSDSKKATFPVARCGSGLPRDYAVVLKDIKARIQRERLRVVLSANSAMVQLYWDIGKTIVARQDEAGWGAKVIDRLSLDLRSAFPDQHGFSPRNLKYMRAFAAAWPDAAIVRRLVAQLPWRQNIALLEQLDRPDERRWYAEQTLQNGWSQSVLVVQIRHQAHRRRGRAITNFESTLPPTDSDLAGQIFKDPYLFDFLGTA